MIAQSFTAGLFFRFDLAVAGEAGVVALSWSELFPSAILLSNVCYALPS